MASTEQINSIPMASRLMDATGKQSHLYVTVAPRKLNAVETNSIMQELMILEGVVHRLATFALELRHGDHSIDITDGNKQRKFHNHVLIKPGGKLRIGPLEFVGVSRSTEVCTGKIKADLATKGQVVLNYITTPTTGAPVSTTIKNITLDSLTLTHLFTQLPVQIWNALGSMVKEIAGVAYKGELTMSATSVAGWCAIMRVQDNVIKDICAKASMVAVSDGTGISTGIVAQDASDLAREMSLLLLGRLTPRIYNWIYKGQVPGAPILKGGAI